MLDQSNHEFTRNEARNHSNEKKLLPRCDLRSQINNLRYCPGARITICFVALSIAALLNGSVRGVTLRQSSN